MTYTWNQTTQQRLECLLNHHRTPACRQYIISRHKHHLSGLTVLGAAGMMLIGCGHSTAPSYAFEMTVVEGMDALEEQMQFNICTFLSVLLTTVQLNVPGGDGHVGRWVCGGMANMFVRGCLIAHFHQLHPNPGPTRMSILASPFTETPTAGDNCRLCVKQRECWSRERKDDIWQSSMPI